MATSCADVYSNADSGWTKVQSDGVTFYSDLPPPALNSLAKHLIQFREAIQSFPFAELADPSQPKPQLDVLVFSKRREFARLLKTRHFAAFTQPGFERTFLLIGPSAGKMSLQRNARHEYVHYHLRNHPMGYPTWFDEGLAVMLEYLVIDKEHKTQAKLDTHALFKRYEFETASGKAPVLSGLLSGHDIHHWDYKRLEQFYGTVGQLVHYLYFGHEIGLTDHRPNLKSYLLKRDTSLAEALGTSNRRLERQLENYQKRKKFEFQVQVAPVTSDMTHSPITVRERDLLLARAIAPANPKRAVALYKRIIAEHTAEAELYVDLARAQSLADNAKAASISLDLAKRLMPEPSAQYLVQKATMTMAGCTPITSTDCQARWRDASALVRQALELDPSMTAALHLQGVIDLYRGRPGTALNYLRAAHRYAPWVPRLNYHLGECLRLLGDPSAVIYLRNALAWSHDQAWRDIAQKSLSLAIPAS